MFCSRGFAQDWRQSWVASIISPLLLSLSRKLEYHLDGMDGSSRGGSCCTVCSALQGASPGCVLSQGPAKGTAFCDYWVLSRSREWDPSLCHEFLMYGAKLISWTRFWTVVVCLLLFFYFSSSQLHPTQIISRAVGLTVVPCSWQGAVLCHMNYPKTDISL